MMINRHLISISGIIIWTDLKDGDKCPKCKKGILELHGYYGGGHKLECFKCGFRLDGVGD